MAKETLAPQGFRTVDNVIGIQNRVLRLISGGVHTSSGVRKGTLADRIKQKEIVKSLICPKYKVDLI